MAHGLRPLPEIAASHVQDHDSHARSDGVRRRGRRLRRQLSGLDKAYVSGADGVRVPVRRIALSGGEPALDVYDTSGPLGHDVRDGLPELRREWIRGRAVVEGERRLPPAPGSDMSEALKARTRRALRGTAPVTQLHYARKGEITPEMEFIAMREGLAGRVRPRRGRARPRHHPRQHQPPRARADDHRPQLPGEDQRQHRQLRRRARRSRRRSRSCAGRRCGAPTR